MQVGIDVAAVVERAVRAGWVLESPPERKPWGTVDATLGDADGNRVVVAGAF
jgi:uncharacterized glyoxalase superfamily protein PhnB